MIWYFRRGVRATEELSSMRGAWVSQFMVQFKVHGDWCMQEDLLQYIAF